MAAAAVNCCKAVETEEAVLVDSLAAATCKTVEIFDQVIVTVVEKNVDNLVVCWIFVHLNVVVNSYRKHKAMLVVEGVNINTNLPVLLNFPDLRYCSHGLVLNKGLLLQHCFAVFLT